MRLIMKQGNSRKMVVLGIVLVFLGLTAVPAINAGILNRRNSINILRTPVQETREDSTYRLLILAPSRFADELQPLVCHKEKMGMTTRLVTLCEIYDQMYWQGRDEAEKIKYFIKNAIENWGIEYVLFVGGKKGQLPFWHLPVRYVNMECDWEPHYISDLYFADIYDSEGNFSSWDSDGDGLYGEWYYDEVAEDQDIDLSPDVAVGRLPCRYDIEVRIMVDKIIKYETNTYGKSWFNDFTVFAGDTYPEMYNPNWTGYEGEFYGDRAIENMTSFNPLRFYTSDGSFTGPTDVQNAINNGCGFIYFVGHGCPRSWSTHLPNSEVFVDGLHIYSVHKYRNRYMLPVCVLSGCHNLQFDVSIFNFFDSEARWKGEAAYESIGWRLVRKIGGGTIATIGTSALGYTKEDKDSFNGGINEIEVEFFRQYGQNHKEILGDAFATAVEWYVDTYPIDWNTSSISDSWIDAQVVQSWTLFGDPSLQIGGYPQ